MDSERAKALVVVLAAACGVFAGCGGSYSGPASAVHTTASARPGAESSAAVDARAINLHPGDVPDSVVGAVQEPGFVVRPGHAGPVSLGPFDVWIERCDGGVSITGSREVVGYSSPHFTRGIQPAQPGASLEGVRSVVFVFGSEAAAQHELSVLASARARACLKRDGDAEGETHLEVSSLPTPPGFAVYGVVWDGIPSSYRPPRRRYRDLLAFTTGRMLVVIHTDATPHPFRATLEARLLRLLYERAESRRL